MKNKGVDPVSSSAAESVVASIDSNIKRKDPQLLKPYPQPLQKKQRRCWSPDLHKHFFDALQQLGGIESVTPKQIREAMNVKDLTNDEVKSHLQANVVCYEEGYQVQLKKELFLGDAISDLPPVENNEARDEQPYDSEPKQNFRN